MFVLHRPQSLLPRNYAQLVGEASAGRGSKEAKHRTVYGDARNGVLPILSALSSGAAKRGANKKWNDEHRSAGDERNGVRPFSDGLACIQTTITEEQIHVVLAGGPQPDETDALRAESDGGSVESGRVESGRVESGRVESEADRAESKAAATCEDPTDVASRGQEDTDDDSPDAVGQKDERTGETAKGEGGDTTQHEEGDRVFETNGDDGWMVEEANEATDAQQKDADDCSEFREVILGDAPGKKKRCSPIEMEAVECHSTGEVHMVEICGVEDEGEENDSTPPVQRTQKRKSSVNTAPRTFQNIHTPTDLEIYSVKALRDLCKQHGHPSRGVRAELLRIAWDIVKSAKASNE